MFDTTLNQHIQIFQTLANLKPAVEQTAGMLVDCLQAGGKIMFCGNGGSAADSQHLASEFVGRFVADRRPLAALALSTDTSALTSIGNDYGFDDIFSRQIMALGKPGDIVVAITTSGNSSNIVKAVTCAQENKIRSIGIFIGHYWCARIEEQLAR
jgi:D-sedoheptulose 7-phosphate isomerase